MQGGKPIEAATSKQEETRINNNRPSKIETSGKLDPVARWAQCKVTGKNIMIRSYSAACANDNTLFVYGGMQILNGILSDFHQIDLGDDVQKFQWKDVVLRDSGVTPGPRAKHAMVCYNNCIYLVGGIKGGAEDSNEIYKFSIAEGRWLKLEPQGAVLPPIDSFGCVLFADKIYLLCGYNGKTCQLLNSVYEYDITSNKLALKVTNQPNPTKHSAPEPRTNCSGAYEDGKIYIFGGRTDEQRLNDLWVFNLETGHYEFIKDTTGDKPVVRSGHTLTSHDGNIYLFGGIHEVTWELDDLNIYVPKVAVLDIQMNNWRTIDIDSPRRKQIQQDQKNAESKPTEKRIPLRKKQSLFHETLLSLPNHSNNNHRPNSPKNQTNLQFHFTREASDTNINVSPGKMIDEQRKKAFLQKKAQMLKEFDVSEKDRDRYINVEPVTQAMRNSLDIIGNPNPQQQNPMTVITTTNTVTAFNRQGSPHAKNSDFNKSTCSRFLEPLANCVNLLPNKKPCARDGHNAVLMGNSIIVFGGDRHQMSFNDIFKLNLQALKKQLQK